MATSKEVRAAQLEVLEAVSDAFDSLMHDGATTDGDVRDVVEVANRRLKQDGHPFEFIESCGSCYIAKEVKE